MADRMSGPRRNEARCFNENSPRPPVPGEETCYTNRYRPQSPALTPRRSSFANRGQQNKLNDGLLLAPMGFEPEGSCSRTTMETDKRPVYVRWAINLHLLLQDPIGLDLFKKYLEQEDELQRDQLNFWFACEGLKEVNEPNKIISSIRAILNRYVKKSHLSVSKEFTNDAHRRWRENKSDKRIFDRLQCEVERIISETSYANFIRSDIYLKYVQDYQNNDNHHSYEFVVGTSTAAHDLPSLGACAPTNLLPTLHEDSEFGIPQLSQSACGTPGEFKLTKDILIKTQQSRAMDLRPKPEAYAGLYLKPGTSPYHMSSSRSHAQYSYNPVSRQDSELQSLSSDARTESDSMSQAGSSVDGYSMGRRCSKRQLMKHNRQMKESASLNHDHMSETIIPRTQRIPQDSTKILEPKVFFERIRIKLEQILKDRESQEKIERLKDDDNEERNLIELNKKIDDCSGLKVIDNNEHDNDQSILDQHVSRIWTDPTPSRSPCASPPRSDIRVHKTRKEKDVFSTVSVDSGNLHDFIDTNEAACGGSVCSFSSNIPKSKSVPSQYSDTLHNFEHYQGQDQKYRKSSIKKSTPELEDSGVSVFSDVPPALPIKEHRNSVTTWLNNNDKKLDTKHGSRHMKKYDLRSDSSERAIRESWCVPAQPIASDPGMPLLPQPHTPTQLDEAARRLKDRLAEDERARGCGASSSSIAGSCSGAMSRRHQPIVRQPSQQQQQQHQQQYESQCQLPSVSNQSTLRKSRQDTGSYTTALITFFDESVPYLVKIPGQNISLKQFKEFVPKKGSYRYFFKTECDDEDVKVIQEEITDDADTLPLWSGKITAQIKPLE